ncbi:ATP-dependent nuclease [Caenispirillum salinarum]|uniref:ATP-dependent nuclease n=1 Tax=Caenispirillum salinarum TaxID=859058 RepID=UPI00384FF634
MINKVRVQAFKKLQDVELELSPINVLVGGNNSGKSCILQGIHFGIALSQARFVANADQFPPEKLRYCPTDDFLNLRYERKLTEGASINFEYHCISETMHEVARISLQRGRNGVVKAQNYGGGLLEGISDPKGFFSVYVPGLAGVSLREEYRSELVVNNGIARGDANLYLRNVLLRIFRDGDKKAQFSKYLTEVFPGVSVDTKFDEGNDLWLNSTVTSPEGDVRPLDMVGTGLLQAIQIIAYVTNYAPKLLLLDEPDAHLHPSNQRLLANTLKVITRNSNTTVILATHSRHLLDALSEAPTSKLFWVRNGGVKVQEDWSDVAVLMDIGALDKGERLLHGSYRYLVWSEDSDVSWLQILFEANGFNPDEFLVFSYKSSSKFDAAKLMDGFMRRIKPGVKTIIHRDRDFMTDDEVARMKKLYGISDRDSSVIFVTEGSDIESYFVRPEHISYVLDIPLQDAIDMLDDIIRNSVVEATLQFREKREQIKKTLYKKDPEQCPETTAFISGSNVCRENVVGKTILKKIMNEIQMRKLGSSGAIKQKSPYLRDKLLEDIVVAELCE